MGENHQVIQQCSIALHLVIQVDIHPPIIATTIGMVDTARSTWPFGVLRV